MASNAIQRADNFMEQIEAHISAGLVHAMTFVFAGGFRSPKKGHYTRS